MSNAKESADLVPLLESARELRECLGNHSIREVSRTRLARHSREVMTEMAGGDAFLRVKMGTRDMLVVDQDFYDRACRLLESVENRLHEMDPVLHELRGRFDRLTGRMNQPGARDAASEALFGESAPETLHENFEPGRTEQKS